MCVIIRKNHILHSCIVWATPGSIFSLLIVVHLREVFITDTHSIAGLLATSSSNSQSNTAALHYIFPSWRSQSLVLEVTIVGMGQYKIFIMDCSRNTIILNILTSDLKKLCISVMPSPIVYWLPLNCFIFLVIVKSSRSHLWWRLDFPVVSPTMMMIIRIILWIIIT